MEPPGLGYRGRGGGRGRVSEPSWRQKNVILKSMKFIRSPHPPPDHLGRLPASRSLCVKKDSQEEARATWAVVPDSRTSGRPPAGQGEPRGARACFHASCGGRVMWDSPAGAVWTPSLGHPAASKPSHSPHGPICPRPPGPAIGSSITSCVLSNRGCRPWGHWLHRSSLCRDPRGKAQQEQRAVCPEHGRSSGGLRPPSGTAG